MASVGFNEAVKDRNGNPVLPYSGYLIQVADQPGKWVFRGQRTRDVMCPQVAVLSETAIPVQFLQKVPLTYVPVNSKISIRFEDYPPDPCPESGIWKVDKSNSFPKPDDITANGKAFVQNTTFMIQKANTGYNFVDEFGNTIGVYTDTDTKTEYLVVDNNTPALEVIFVPWSSEAVKDINGDPVLPNSPYKIQVADQPEKWVSRGQRTSDVKCPQVAMVSETAIPVEFLQDVSLNYVPVNSKISIRFEDCRSESGIWRVDGNTHFIPADGRAFDQDSTFMIQKLNNGYKFVYESDNIGVNSIYLVVDKDIPALAVVFVPWIIIDAGDKTSGSS